MKPIPRLKSCSHWAPVAHAFSSSRAWNYPTWISSCSWKIDLPARARAEIWHFLSIIEPMLNQYTPWQRRKYVRYQEQPKYWAWNIARGFVRCPSTWYFEMTQQIFQIQQKYKIPTKKISPVAPASSSATSLLSYKRSQPIVCGTQKSVCWTESSS